MNTTDQAASIWKRIIEIAECLHERAKAMDEKDGIRRRLPIAQARAFIQVCERAGDDGLRVKDLANLLSLTPGTVSPLVEVLVREGLVERHPDPDDRRAVRLRPSAFGAHVHRVRTEHLTELVNQLLGSFSRAEVADLHDGLNHLYALISDGAPSPPDALNLPDPPDGDAP